MSRSWLSFGKVPKYRRAVLAAIFRRVAEKSSGYWCFISPVFRRIALYLGRIHGYLSALTEIYNEVVGYHLGLTVPGCEKCNLGLKSGSTKNSRSAPVCAGLRRSAPVHFQNFCTTKISISGELRTVFSKGRAPHPAEIHLKKCTKKVRKSERGTRRTGRGQSRRELGRAETLSRDNFRAVE